MARGYVPRRTGWLSGGALDVPASLGARTAVSGGSGANAAGASGAAGDGAGDGEIAVASFDGVDCVAASGKAAGTDGFSSPTGSATD